MTLPVSPNNISFSQISSETGRTPGTAVSLSQAGIRVVADVQYPDTPGTLSFSDFYGKYYRVGSEVNSGWQSPTGDNICLTQFGSTTFASTNEYIYSTTNPSSTNAWTQVHYKQAGYLTDCASSGTSVVVVGIFAGALRSTNGTTWTDTFPSHAGEYIRCISYANGLYLMGGDSGVLYTSNNDGASWTARTSNTSDDIRAFTYGNGKWVGVTSGGDTIYSSDGTTWINAGKLPDNIKAWDVLFDGTYFIAAGGISNTAICYSTDGISWSSAVVSSGGSLGLKIVTDGDNYIITGLGNGDISTTKTPTDRYSWRRRSFSPYDRHPAAIWTGSEFIIGRESSTSTARGFWVAPPTDFDTTVVGSK